jgi:small subunit ribosomal protein S16
MGGPKKPFYRVVVSDSRVPRDGRVIEELGTYDPRQEPSLFKVDQDRAREWLASGAEPTDRVRRLLQRAGVL